MATRSGEYLLSESSIGMNAEEGYYHLLVGILNSEFNGEGVHHSLTDSQRSCCREESRQM